MKKIPIYLSIIIPAYNEEVHIKNTILKLINILKKKYKSFEIIIVDDGSNDKTYFIAKNLKKKFLFIKVVKSKKNKGVQYAIYLGAKNSIYKFITHFPGDDSYSKKSIMNLINFTGKKELIVGYRSNYKKVVSSFRYILSSTLILLMKFITNKNLKDFHGPYICPSIFLKKKFKAYGYDGQIEIMNFLLNKNLTVKEVSVQVLKKTILNSSAIKLSTCLMFIKTLIRIYVTNIKRKI